jgi:hypothetical protein
MRGLDPQIIPYNDDNEDQNIQPGDVLNHGYKDELSLDYSALFQTVATLIHR